MTDMSDPVITHVDSIAGGKIGVRTLGNGPGLIVIHGSLDEGSQWIPFAEALAARFTVHLVDSRGRGLSDDFPADYGPATIVADHRAVLKLAGDGAVLFGHSFGATSVLQTAVAEAPELAGVVLYEPPLPLGGPYSGEEIDHYASSLERGDVDGALSRAFVTLVGGTEEDLALLRETPVWPEMLAVAPTWLPELRLVDSLPFDTDAFHAINVPVLGIRGGRSGDRLRGTTEAAVAAVPHGTLVDIPHIEHSGHLTDPADLAQAVLHWYDTVLAQTSLNDPPVSDCNEGSITVSDTFLTTTDAHQLSSLFVQYFDAGNVEGLLSLYEEGATLYVPGSTPSEPVPLRAAFEQFAAMGLHVEVKNAIVLVNGNLALSHGDLALVSADQRIEVKTAEVLRRQDDGTWRYVIDNAIGSAILEALTPDNS